MIRRRSQIAAWIAMLILLQSASIYAANIEEVSAITDAVMAEAYQTIQTFQPGVPEEEWMVLALLQGGYGLSQTEQEQLIRSMKKYVAEKRGVLNQNKYTEYSRAILLFTALGVDPRDIEGYNLLIPLGDYEKTIYQGINGSIFALIALDSMDYPIPVNSAATVQATRELYLAHILEQQLPDGGFALGGMVSDPDVTAMAVQALANDQDRNDVKATLHRAINCLSEMQQDTGGYVSGGLYNLESCAQVLIAMNAMGISVEDPRFVKNSNTVLDAIASFYIGNGQFAHMIGGGKNQLSTAQGMLALTAYARQMEGKKPLYDLSDINLDQSAVLSFGLGKHADVSVPKITAFVFFSDLEDHRNRTAIEALAARGIVNGKSDNFFDPDGEMTRAEFAAIVVRGLGLSKGMDLPFQDVKDHAWYKAFVGIAYRYEIVQGTNAKTFTPNGTITREEAAVMIQRAAKLCGFDLSLDDREVQNILAQFGDYKESGKWAQEALAFCYKNGILDQAEQKIRPKKSISRCEVSEMLYQLLQNSELI